MSIYGEIPTGSVNGTNTVFTLSNPYWPGSTRVFVGTSGTTLDRLELGVAYTETTPTSGVFTLTTAPATGSKILVDYDLQATATTTAGGTWTFNPAGYPLGSAMFYGPTLFPAGLNAGATGTGMVVLGPNGATTNFPAVEQGVPGLPPVLNTGSTTTLAAGSPATFQLVQTAEGGPGTASQYTVNAGLPQGIAGPAYQTEIISASDLTGTPAAGYTIVYVPAQGNTPAQTAWAAMPFSAVYNATSIANTTTSGGGNRTLYALSIPAQANLWVPIIWAQSTITGTASTVQVDLVARQNNGTTAFNGTQVAVGNGVPGAGPTNQYIMPAWTTQISGDSGAGVIPANTAVEIYLNAEQQDSSEDAYSTSNTTYTLGVLPLGIISSSYVATDVVSTAGLSVTSGTGSFSFTAGANDNYVLVAAGFVCATSYLLMSTTVTYGGVAMTLLGLGEFGSNGFVGIWGLNSPAPGPQTVALSSTGATVTGIVATAVSFQNWSQTSIGLLAGSDGTALATEVVDISPGQLAVAVFASYGGNPITVTSANTSTLFTKTNGGNGSLALTLVSAPGTGNALELTGTTAAAQNWATCVVTLI